MAAAAGLQSNARQVVFALAATFESAVPVHTAAQAAAAQGGGANHQCSARGIEWGYLAGERGETGAD